MSIIQLVQNKQWGQINSLDAFKIGPCIHVIRTCAVRSDLDCDVWLHTSADGSAEFSPDFGLC